MIKSAELKETFFPSLLPGQHSALSLVFGLSQSDRPMVTSISWFIQSKHLNGPGSLMFDARSQQASTVKVQDKGFLPWFTFG
jgi:hypothetical protein